MSEPTQRLPVAERGEEDPGREPAPDASHATQGSGAKSGRFWSARRIPAALCALVLLGGVGILLYDIAAVRSGRPAMQWRRSLGQELAERPLDDTAVLIGAGVAAAIGLWLLLLALTPGLRPLLPMRRAHPEVRAGLHRDAAAMVLRDRAMEVAGVQSVRVRVKRSRAKVRAVSHFRELDDVRAELDTTLGDGIKGLGLSRNPRLSVRVARPGKKG
ncbi:DUF6286 domain-containing protein [Streptomyces kunmingensis]|uniref:DUF6286 domain-containing protein n=1 Tax=Streptomyces kunmingensis TaxID=68225 RepID=A0ABU6CIU0_9ACTN|nr:DUF6286 domain-containing protein [Streptomyces kunmingensis]MEB3964612.1 DUF6286 domain-containing protein [Streptomyces kunmingensis]